MQETTNPTAQAVQVPAEVGPRARAAAREEVDPGCQLLMTSDTGIVALVLPDRLHDRPKTPELQRRLASIGRRFSVQEHNTEAGEALATAARRSLGGSLAARTARRTEPGASPPTRRERARQVLGLRRLAPR